jgi:hypothetical protein
MEIPMSTEHHENLGKSISVESAALINVKVIEIEKEVEVPKYKTVEVEVPVYKEKEYEIPVLKKVTYEVPVITEVPKLVEVPQMVDVPYEVPIPVEKPYSVPVPVEEPYSLPIVSMEEVSKAALKASILLQEVANMTHEVEALIASLRTALAEAQKDIPDIIKVPKIEYEKIVVKDVKVEEETIHVIGKVVARKA